MSVRKVQDKLRSGVLQSRVKRQLLLGASLVVLTASPAWADCAPDPVIESANTTCIGNDPDGILIDKNHVNLRVLAGATVDNVKLTTPHLPFQDFTQNFIDLDVSGTIINGVRIENTAAVGPFPPNPFTVTRASITVRLGGAIGGTGIVLNAAQPNPNPFSRSVMLSVSNSGTITASGINTPAITTTNNSSVIESVENNSTGTIQGISGIFEYIVNYGSISIANNSAINSTSLNLSPVFTSNILNYGSVTNNSALSTISYTGVFDGFRGIYNHGLIENLGSGDAVGSGAGSAGTLIWNYQSGLIHATSGVAIRILGNTNQASIINEGVITAPSTAIAVDGSLQLTNKGIINGDVLTARGYFVEGSTINNEGGTINGNVDLSNAFASQTRNVFLAVGGHLNGNLVLGNGGDTLVAELAANGSPAGISGTISGGPDSTLHFLVDSNRAATLAAPTFFSTLVYDLSNNAALVLTNATPSSRSLSFVGTGSVDLTADLSGSGFRPILDVDATNLDFITRGTLSFSGPGVAVHTSNGNFTNDGTIRVSDNSGSLARAIFGSGHVVNNGLIELGGAIGFEGDLYAFGQPKIFVNNGTIRQIVGAPSSIGVIGLATDVINNGTISVDGSAVYLAFGSTLTNNGLVKSVGSPTVTVDSSRLVNGANGVIDRGVGQTAIDFLSGSVTNLGRITGNVIGYAPFGFQSSFYRFDNSGVVQGNVDLGLLGIFPSKNVVVLRAGSSISGDLSLGSGGDALLVELGVPGPLGGVAGTTNIGPDSAFRYLVSANTTSGIKLAPAGFTSFAYELTNGAKLTLTGPVPVNTTLNFAGEGAVETQLTMTGNGLAPLMNFQATAYLSADLASQIFVPNLIAATSKGTLSATHSDASSPASAMVLNSYGSFTNLGTINVRDNVAQANPALRLVGISGPGTLINKGTINVGGGIGMFAYEPNFEVHFVNDGMIKQIAGAPAGIGMLLTMGDAINNGTISTAGPAVMMGYIDPNTTAVLASGTLTNNGLLESTGGPAVAGAGSTFINSATGTVRGKAGGPAMAFEHSAYVENRGLIVGDVVTGTVYPTYASSTYVSNGGTLRGNVKFSDNSDLLVLNSGSITGYADGAGGYDTFSAMVSALSSGSFDFGVYRNFERLEFFGPGAIALKNPVAFDWLEINGANFTVGTSQTITATSAFYLRGGSARIDGRLTAGYVEVNSGGILSGSGLIDPFDLVISNGFLAPGSSGAIGSLSVRGDVTIYPEANLIFDVSNSSSDQLRAVADSARTGIVNLLGGSILFTPVSGGPRANQNYKIITAQGGVFGTFSSVQGSVGVLAPVLTYGANEVTLRYQAGSLAAQLPASASSIERSFALALDSLRTGSYANLSSFYGAVDVMDPRSLGLALGSLNPATAGEAGGFYRQQGMQMVDLLAGRIGQLGTDRASPGKIAVLGLPGVAGLMAHGSTGTQAAALPSSLTRSLSGNDQVPARLPDGMSGFVSSGIDSRSGGLAAAGGTDRRSWHMAMGLEMRLGDQSYWGTAFAHTEGLSGVRGSQAEAQTTQVAAYGAWRFSSRGYLGGLVAMGVNRIGTMRNVWDGQSSLAIQAHSAAFSYSLQAEAGYDLTLPGALTLTPHAALRYSGFGIDRLSETGNQAALRLSDINDKRLEAQLGVRLSGAVRLGGGWRLAPRAELEWNRTMAGGNGSALVQFAAVDAAGFRIALGRDAPSSLKAKGGITLGNDKVSFTLAGSSETGWAGQQDSRAAAEFLLAF